MTPYLIARRPPAFVATLPPRRRGVLAGEHRIDEPVLGGRRVELLQRDAGLDDGHVVLEVDLEDRRSSARTTRGRRPRAGCTRRTSRCPEPRAVSGIRCSAQRLTIAGDLVGVGRTDDAQRRHGRRRQGFVVACSRPRSRRRRGRAAHRRSRQALRRCRPQGRQLTPPEIRRVRAVNPSGLSLPLQKRALSSARGPAPCGAPPDTRAVEPRGRDRPARACVSEVRACGSCCDRGRHGPPDLPASSPRTVRRRTLSEA